MKGKTSIEEPTVLNDRYRLTDPIGVGGTADVWRATDELLNRQVAVKVLREVADPTQRDRFIEEARTLASFNHPGLVVLLDAGILGARPFLVMTLVDDGTLAARIARGPVDSPVVTSIGAQIARALDYVHERGVLHRDVKPSNVLLCGDGRAVLSDFGIARLLGSAMHHTRTGDAIGSPAYLAPEQVAGEDLTPALDVYSLGLVLLEALTAQRAFQGPPVEAAVARLTVAPAIPTTVGTEWASLLRRMTHRIPQERPTAREVAEELGSPELARSLGSLRSRTPEFDPQPTGPLLLGDREGASTRTIEAVMPASVNAAPEADLDAASERTRRWPALVAALGIAALAFTAFTVLHPARGVSKNDAPAVPTSVPAKYRAGLSHLHDAVNGPAR